MKKLLALLVILCLAASFAAFGEETKVFDAGRVSVSASESWNVIYPDDSTVLLIKGLVPLLSPCVSITYYPMGSLFLDAKELYQDVVDLDPVTTGDYVWTGYDCSSMGMAYTNAVANLPSGSLYVSITRKDDLSISNEEVQAILASIQVVPSATADWFTLSEDGVLTVTLPQPEGFAWQTSGSANSPLDDERSDPRVEIIEEKEEDGVYTLSFRDSTDGWYTQFLSLGSETASGGSASITAVVSEGKITMVSKAELEIYDEPQEYDITVASPEDYLGNWFDKNSQRATLEITALENGQYQALVSYSSSASETTEWRMTAAVDFGGDLAYKDGTKANMTYNDDGEVISEETVYEDGEGWFTFTGDSLMWTDFKEETAYAFSFVRGE